MGDNGSNEITEKNETEIVEVSITDDIHVPADEISNPAPTATIAASTAASSSSQSVPTGQTTLTARIWSCAKWTGLKIFNTMDAIGEVVCHVLGLDDSRYQYVIDGMDENDWRVAREVQAKKDRAAQNGQNAA
jgi:hypothetical protein